MSISRTSLLLAALALTACPDPAKDKPKATVATPAPAPAPAPGPIANAVAFPFTQADSKITWVGAKVTGKHDGGFTMFGGIIEVVESDITKSRVRAAIDMNSTFSDESDLTDHLKGPDFFDVGKFPETSFVSTAIAKGADDKFTVTGNLTLHGVTKTISFPASITMTEGEVNVAAEFAINRKDFGIVYPGRPDNLIKDEVALKLDLHARKRAKALGQ
ncbi:MAG: YceI family protein [Archangium sp.]|nr:YceI family protein [Archangium sp.]